MNLAAVIAAEVGPLLRKLPQGALEPGDLEAEGWLAALTSPYTNDGATRLYIRGAMRMALRQEYRALGIMGKRPRDIFWPVWWPQQYPCRRIKRRRCACGTVLAPQQRRCSNCVTAKHRTYGRAYQRETAA